MKQEIAGAIFLHQKGHIETSRLKIAKLREKYQNKIDIFEVYLSQKVHKAGIDL